MLFGISGHDDGNAVPMVWCSNKDCVNIFASDEFTEIIIGIALRIVFSPFFIAIDNGFLGVIESIGINITDS